MGLYRVLLVYAAAVMSCISSADAAEGKTPNSADTRAIEKLHQKDVEATLSGDPTALADLFTDDAVLLEPGSPAVVGKNAILKKNEEEKAAHPNSKVLSYSPEIKSLEVVDGWAFEWTHFDASFQESAGLDVKSFHGKGLRVLKREPDGSWKFARVMWNLEH
jgi:uncharacterized protein (TIGR02246 family)